MEKEVPSWLNKDFLILALQGGEDVSPRVDITKFSLTPAVPPGNNYTSDLFRVNIEYRNEGSPDHRSISLIVKAPIETGIHKDFSEKGGFFSIEPKLYKTVLSIFLEKFDFEFGPKYFYTDERNTLVLKDLKPDGYLVCDKFKQLDIKHCRKVVNCLAKFHAASVAYNHESPELMETFHEQYYKEESLVASQMKNWMETSVKLFIETLAKKGLKSMEHYVSERFDKLWNNLVKILAPRTNSLNILNHGDCWTNNLLFKYNDSEEIIDVKFIDYQLVKYSSPVIDLLFFIWSSGDEDVRDNHQQELYNTYLQTLNSTLEELNCQERLTHEELRDNLRFYSDWILLTIAFVLPLTLNDSDNVVDFGKTSGFDDISNRKDDKYCAMFNSKRFLELLPGYMKQFERFINSF